MIKIKIESVTTGADVGVFDLPIVPPNGSIVTYESKTFEVINAQYNTSKTKVGVQEKNILNEVILTCKEV